MPASDLEPPFVSGVASFDPTGESVILWTRAPGVARVRWCVAPAVPGANGDGAGAGRPDDPVASGEAEVPVEADHCVAVTVDGLDPATSYRYWFEAGAVALAGGPHPHPARHGDRAGAPRHRLLRGLRRAATSPRTGRSPTPTST